MHDQTFQQLECETNLGMLVGDKEHMKNLRNNSFQPNASMHDQNFNDILSNWL
jgi:hypothetical protein